MTDIDLFGQPLPIKEPKKKGKATGYAAPPGSGPAGETCKTCVHYRSVRYHRKTYPKCALRQPWTHGPGTDIKAKSPACARWQKPEENK